MLQLEKYNLAFDISPVPMLLVSGDGIIRQTNELLDKLFQYDDEELIGQNVDVLVPDEIKGHHHELRNAYFRTPSKRRMGQGRDLAGRTKYGDTVPLELGLDEVVIDGVQYALVVTLDIRQRIQQERQLRLAMDSTASAMIMVDSGGTIAFANHAAVDLFGYAESEMLGNKIEMLVPQEIRRVHPVYRDSFFTKNESRSMGGDADLYAQHRDGRRIPVEIALTPVETPNGRLVMSTIIDLSERRLAEQIVAKKSEELEQLNSELTQFAYSASHDLKAPLSSIAGLMSICMDDLEDGNVDEVRANLLKCMQIGERSAAKVEGVLEIARVGRDGEVRESVHFEPMIQDIWLDMTGANTAGIKLVLNLKHLDPLMLQAQTLKVVLENLLSNAIRYGDEKKDQHCVTITTEITDGSLSIDVYDNGVGISVANQAIVFDMFKRIDEKSGDGLGLALVKKQVERLGGDISLSSTEGEGTKFSLLIPLESES